MNVHRTREWKFIGMITDEWVARAYPNAPSGDVWKRKDQINDFLAFLGLTESQFVEGYKRASDKNEWARRTGLDVVAFYNDRLGKGYATNTARAHVSTIRAFCREEKSRRRRQQPESMSSHNKNCR